MQLFFAHNCHNRPKLLRRTIEIEKSFFPDAKHYTSLTTDGGIDPSLFSDTVVIPTVGVGHQLGCSNCFYSSISKICEEHDDGIIIFTHDDVSIYDINLVKRNMQFLEDKASFLIRRPHPYGGEFYYQIDFAYLRISRVKEFFSPFSNEKLKSMDGHTDANGWDSTEVFAARIFKQIKDGIVIDETMYGQGMEGRLQFLRGIFGFHHENFGITGWTE